MGELKHLGGYMVGTYGKNNCSKASSNITRNDLEKKSKHRPFLYWQNFAKSEIKNQKTENETYFERFHHWKKSPPKKSENCHISTFGF